MSPHAPSPSPSPCSSSTSNIVVHVCGASLSADASMSSFSLVSHSHSSSSSYSLPPTVLSSTPVYSLPSSSQELLTQNTSAALPVSELSRMLCCRTHDSPSIPSANTSSSPHVVPTVVTSTGQAWHTQNRHTDCLCCFPHQWNYMTTNTCHSVPSFNHPLKVLCGGAPLHTYCM